MQTRIKVIEYANGFTEYIPQYKDITIWPGWSDVDPFGNVDNRCLESVKKCIDEFIERMSEVDREEMCTPPVVSYINYP